MLSEESRLHVLRALDDNPSLSQRDLARQLNISLGKVNYCLKALIEKGWVKASNFRKSDQKLRYLYMLTPTGIEQKSRLTVSFLQRKLAEYNQLEQEINSLRQEINQTQPEPKTTSGGVDPGFKEGVDSSKGNNPYTSTGGVDLEVDPSITRTKPNP